MLSCNLKPHTLYNVITNDVLLLLKRQRLLYYYYDLFIYFFALKFQFLTSSSLTFSSLFLPVPIVFVSLLLIFVVVL